MSPRAPARDQGGDVPSERREKNSIDRHSENKHRRCRRMRIAASQRKHTRRRNTENQVSDDDRDDTAKHEADCSTALAASRDPSRTALVRGASHCPAAIVSGSQEGRSSGAANFGHWAISLSGAGRDANHCSAAIVARSRRRAGDQEPQTFWWGVRPPGAGPAPVGAPLRSWLDLAGEQEIRSR